jgi:hypothetical protein
MYRNVGRADFLAVVLLVSLAGYCQRPKPQTVLYVEAPVAAGIDVVNVGPFQERLIREASSSLFGRKCTQAFNGVGLPSPYDLVTRDGVVIRRSSDLYIYPAYKLGLMSETTREAYAWEFSLGHAQGGTVRGRLGGMSRTIDGRPIIFLHDTAFLGESFWERRLSLREVLIHEFIHAVGQKRTPGILGPLQDDLAGFEHYEMLMEACR